ncbi:hypothetical protein ABPG72_006536 [Tetrahymena utriculariae]
MYSNQRSQAQNQIMSQKQMYHLSNIFERLVVSLNKIVHIQSQGKPQVNLSQFSLFSEGQLQKCLGLENTYLDISTIIKSFGFSRSEVTDQKSSEMLYHCVEKYLNLQIQDKHNQHTNYNQILEKIQRAKNSQLEQFPGQSFIAGCLEMLLYAILNDKQKVNSLDLEIKRRFFNYNESQTIQNPLNNDMMFHINNNMYKNDVRYENLKDNQTQLNQLRPNIPTNFVSTSSVVQNSRQYNQGNAKYQDASYYSNTTKKR